MQVQREEVEAVLMGKCVQYIRDKILEEVGGDPDRWHSFVNMDIPRIVWGEDNGNDRMSTREFCKVTIRWSSGRSDRPNKCGIKAVEPFDERLLAPPQAGVLEDILDGSEP